MNESAVVIRTVDLTITVGGQDVPLRAAVAGYTAELAGEAERRMRAQLARETAGE